MKIMKFVLSGFPGFRSKLVFGKEPDSRKCRGLGDCWKLECELGLIDTPASILARPEHVQGVSLRFSLSASSTELTQKS